MQLFFSPLALVSLSFLGGLVLARVIPLETTHWMQVGTFTLILAFLLFIFRPLRENTKRPAFLFQLSPFHYLLPFFFIFGAYYFQFNHICLAVPPFPRIFGLFHDDWLINTT